MIFGLLLTAVFVALNGFFVTAEFALVKLRATQVQKLAQRPTAAARAAVEICSRLDRYLSATQLGITLASIGLGSVAEPRVAVALERVLHPLHLRAATIHDVSHALSFAVLTSAHILFGELVPKLIAISAAERAALFASLPLRMFYWVSWPALMLLNGMSSVLLRLMGFPSRPDAEGALSEDEILHVLGQAYARGRLSDAKRLLLERVMRFSDGVARQVMVPRTEVVLFDADLELSDAIRLAQDSGFTRYPIAEGGNLDKVIGYVNVKDLMLVDPTKTTLRKVMRDAIVVPESAGLFEVMRDMQRRQTPIAVIVDEFGGTSGIATLEDLLEEIVGEIRDEHDEELPRVELRADGTVAADGLATIHDLRANGIDLGDTATDTVGGVVGESLGRLPRRGDVVRVGKYEIKVAALRRRRIERVLIRERKLTERPPAAEPE